MTELNNIKIIPDMFYLCIWLVAVNSLLLNSFDTTQTDGEGYIFKGLWKNAVLHNLCQAVYFSLSNSELGKTFEMLLSVHLWIWAMFWLLNLAWFKSIGLVLLSAICSQMCQFKTSLKQMWQAAQPLSWVELGSNGEGPWVSIINDLTLSLQMCLY